VSDCYVYALYREDGRPFYIGKGRGERLWAHEADCRPGRSHKDNIIAGMKARGVVVPKERLAVGLTDEMAYELEARLIAKLGREHEGGPLVNLTAGGQGNVSPTPEVRAKIAAATRRTLTGRTRPPEVGAKISAAQRGKPKGPRPAEERQRRAEQSSAAWDEGGAAARPTFSMAGRQHSPETKERMRQAALGRTISLETRAAVSARQTGRTHSAEERSKRSASLRAAWARRKADANG
jgi:hypothetical protein